MVILRLINLNSEFSDEPMVIKYAIYTLLNSICTSKLPREAK